LVQIGKVIVHLLGDEAVNPYKGKYIFVINPLPNKVSSYKVSGARRGRDRTVVRFITSHAISAYHHKRFKFESHSSEEYSIQYYVIKFVSDLRQDRLYSLGTPASSTNKTDCHNMTEILLKVVLNTLTLILISSKIKSKIILALSVPKDHMGN